MINRTFVTRFLGGVLVGSGLLGTPWVLGQEAAKTSAAPEPTAVAAATPPTPALIRQGQNLFLGETRFSAGGPACNSCHNVVNDAVIGGGTLAKDLTEAFDRLEAEGIVGMLPRKGEASPFPVMQAAYQGHEISAEEVPALVAFLQNAAAQRATQKPNDFGLKMLLAGGFGVVILLLLFSLIGRGRKRRCVNQEIYDRQITTG